jgi:hypothetical protein
MIFGVLMLAAMMPTGAPADQSTPMIKVEQVPGKGYRLAVGSFPVSATDSVNAALKVKAEQVCGALKVRWGRYGYNTLPSTDGSATRENYRQSFSCYDPAHDPYQPAPADWKATAKDDADALVFLKRYLASYDTGDATAGVAMMEPLLEMDKAGWRAGRVNKSNGVAIRDIRGPQWALNPEGAAHPGIYAAFGFNGTFADGVRHCGFIVLYRAQPGQYFITQQTVQPYPQGYSEAQFQEACNHL